MKLFDVKKYETPKNKDVNMEKTKYNVSVFLSAYMSARTRCMQPREPKVTSNFSIVPPCFSNQFYSGVEDIVMNNEEAKNELNYLDNLFVKGFSAIQHPFKPEIGTRRKKIFYDRFLNGQSIYITAERNHISEDLAYQESNKAIIQFASALELVEFN